MPTNEADSNPSEPSEQLVESVDLSSYSPGDYDPGRGKFVQILWWFTSLLFFESGWFLLTRAKPMILRLFGARIGDGIVIKPHVRIKYPWLLEVGNFCWIGQQTWIDNLAPVYLGDDVCVSQGAYFCTGSHNYRSRRFDLVTREIVVEKGAWVGAKAIVLGGVTIGRNAILAAGSVAQHEIPAGKVAVGNPATPVRDRPPIENL